MAWLARVWLTAALAWLLKRSIGFTVFVALSLLLIINQGYWEETTETLALVLSAAAVCMVVGVPIGVAAAHRPWQPRKGLGGCARCPRSAARGRDRPRAAFSTRPVLRA